MPNQPWCLDELALMVASKSTIIPVFHDVDPSELRWPQSGDGVESIIRCLCPCLLGEKGRYARDLHMLQKKTTLDPHTNKKKPQHESSTLQKWRKALSDVSNKSGFVFNAYNGLIAVLSRNLREEFMPFLHKLMETMGNLLESGGDRDPEILEQVLSRALGGKTGKSSVGWELGLKDIHLNNNLLSRFYGMELPPVLKAIKSHQDQVSCVPRNGIVLGYSAKTDIEIFAVGNTVLGIQCHPEISEDVFLDILKFRLARGIISEEVANEVILSFKDRQPDQEILKNFCKLFLKKK